MDPRRSVTAVLANRICELILEQAGSGTLILNDLMMADEGAKVFYEMVPVNYRMLRHLEIKGNNISPYGFEMICNALIECQGLKTILAEWNTIGLNATIGLQALLKLVRNVPTIEQVDLKNNRIDHRTVEPLLELIRSNFSWLKVLDLRWNELGQIGGRALLAALQTNTHLRVLQVANNRIGEATMLAIQDYIALGARRSGPEGVARMQQQSMQQTMPMPFSQNEFPDMATQSRVAEIRAKIDIQQREALAYRDKMQVEINAVLNSIKLKGVCLQESQLRLKSLLSEEFTLKEQIKDAERMFAEYRESISRVGFEISVEQTDFRRGKYNLNRESEDLVKKLMERNQLETMDLNDEMARQEAHLAMLLNDRLTRKRDARDKLISLEEDIMRFELEKEGLQNSVTSKIVEVERKRYADTFRQATDKVKEEQGQVAALKRKNEYLNNELTQCVIRGLDRVRKLEGDIFELQKKVKKLHDQMTRVNLQIDGASTKLDILGQEEKEKEVYVELLRKQISTLLSDGNMMLDMVRLNQTEQRKTSAHANQQLYARILELEKAIRNQESSNKLVRNHYDKLCNMLQTQAQNAIYYTMSAATTIAL